MVKIAGKQYQRIDKDGVSGEAINAVVREEALFEIFGLFWESKITSQQFGLKLMSPEILVSLMRSMLIIPEEIEIEKEVNTWNMACRREAKEALVPPFFLMYLRLSDYSETICQTFLKSLEQTKEQHAEFIVNIFEKAIELANAEGQKDSLNSSDPSSTSEPVPGKAS